MSTEPPTPPKSLSAPRLPGRASAIKIALCYAAVGALWILCSNWALHRLVPATSHETVSLLKGWWFIAVTALLLGWALDRYFGMIRRSAQLLQESEERWKHALESAAQAVWDWKPQTHEVLYSPEWKAMLGFEPQEISNTLSEWESRVHPDDLPRVLQEVKRHLAGETPTYASEHRLRCKDGSYKWILDRGRVISRTAGGEPLRAVGTHSDIHRRKQAEERNRLQHDLIQVLAGANHLEDGLRLCLEAAIKADGLTCGGFYLADPTGALHLRAHSGLSPEFTKATGQFAPGSPQGRLAAAGSPVYAEFEELRLNQSEAELREGLHSIAILPILNQGQLLGCLNVASHTHDEIPESARLVLETIAASAGEVIARLHAQEALRESESNFRTFFETIDDLTIVATPEGRIVFGNGAVERKLGFTAEDLAAMTVAELHPPEVRAEAREILGAMFRGERKSCPLPLARKDGQLLPVETRVWFGQWNGRQCLFGLCKDLSAEQEAQQRFERLFRHNPMPMALSELPGQQLADVNDAWLETFGYERGEVIGRTAFDLNLFQNPEEHAQAAARLRESGEIRNVELRVRSKQGTVRDGLFTGEVVSSQGRSYFLTVMLDVTDRRQTEFALRQSEAHYRLLAENTEDFVAVLDRQENRVYISPSFYRVTGWSPDEVLQSPWDTRLHPDDIPAIKRSRAANLAGETTLMEHRIRCRNGDWMWVESRCKPMTDAGGHVEQLLIWQHDITERKQVAEALRRSQELLEKAQAFGHVGSWVAEVGTGGRLEWSDETCRLFGLVPGSFDGTSRSFFALVHPDDREQVRHTGREADRRGEAYELEYRICRPDGQVRWMQQRADIERDATGRPGRKIGTVQDVTERKQAETRAMRDKLRTEFLLELHQRAPQMSDKELYDHVLDRAVRLTESAIGFFHQVSEDQQTVLLTTWNQEALKNCTAAFATHYPLNEAGNWVDCVRQQRPVVYNNYAHSPNQRGLPAGHASVKRFMSIPVLQEGKTRIIFGVGNKAVDYEEEDVEQLQVVANELHKLMAQRTAQAQLRASEGRFRHLVETTFDWIWETDANARYIYASPRVSDLLGYDPEEVLGKTRFDFMPTTEASRVKAAFDDVASRRQPFSALENVSRHKNGREVVLETSAAPVLGSSGELLGYRGMDRDISERKRLESQLRQAQKLEGVGQLAGGVAHDFNNILAAIMMHLGLLQMNPGLDAETQQALKDLDAQAHRAAELTRQLLMFSRRSVLAIRPQDLNEIVANLLKMLTRLIGENIKLNFEGGSRLPSVQDDAGMLEQVLMNLVVNARDAMPKGGRITISTSTAEFSTLDAAVNPDRRVGRFVCLAVSDTGTGMDEWTLKRIFEPFFTTKDVGKGTGLGLATLYGIVAQHKGWVEVTSAIGQGSTFHVFLPAVAQKTEAAAEPAPSAPLQRGHETILLVEDDDKVRRSVAQTLRALGYQVHEAANGQEAMTSWQIYGAQVDLLITDMVMPEGITGLELTERLQRLKPGLRVIISSGYSAEMVQAGIPIQQGIAYLPKPFESKTLSDAVRNCLDRKP